VSADPSTTLEELRQTRKCLAGREDDPEGGEGSQGARTPGAEPPTPGILSAARRDAGATEAK
jgi:hypothetical protein